MTYSEARELVLFEACIEDGNTNGLIVEVRLGGDPGSKRVVRLLDAMKTIFEHHIGKQEIERKLAYALHSLAMEIVNQTSGSSSKSWSKEFLNWERFDILSAAEGVLQGSWPDSWLSYGKRK